jgi:hypothetical protein
VPETRTGEKAPTEPAAPDGRFHLLVIATETLVGEDVHGEIAGRGDARGGGGVDVLVVAPAVTESALQHAFGDVDEAIGTAAERLRESVRELNRDGIEAAATVGDSDPLMAIEDALATFPADEILIVTRPEGDAWLEDDLFERAKQRVAQPITHLALERRGEHEAEIVDREEAGTGTAEPPEREGEGYSRNLPALSVRNVAGIAVAIVGTVILVILAANCAGENVGGDGTDAGCVVRYILAGAAGLVNVAHVVGLMLFESVRYRGLWQRLFAQLSLWGTPAAIVVSLLVH